MICQVCNQDKEKFVRKDSKRLQYADIPLCTDCHRSYRTLYQSKTRTDERIRKNNLSLRYGITVKDYQDMLKVQDGKCAICSRTPVGKNLAVDHNAKTGKVRALLCSTCNQGLGLFYENPDLLRNAIEYIRKHL